MADIKESIWGLFNLFFSTTAGNDAYSLRYHYLCLIFKLAKKNLFETLPDLIVDDLYNLNYNYEHFDKSSGDTNVRLTDYLGKDLTPQELEIRLHKYLNKMFLALEEVMKDYGFSGLGYK